jgi:hypothetical protein
MKILAKIIYNVILGSFFKTIINPLRTDSCKLQEFWRSKLFTFFYINILLFRLYNYKMCYNNIKGYEF